MSWAGRMGNKLTMPFSGRTVATLPWHTQTTNQEGKELQVIPWRWAVETACKVVFTQQFKRSGMAWTASPQPQYYPHHQLPRPTRPLSFLRGPSASEDRPEVG